MFINTAPGEYHISNRWRWGNILTNEWHYFLGRSPSDGNLQDANIIPWKTPYTLSMGEVSQLDA